MKKHLTKAVAAALVLGTVVPASFASAAAPNFTDIDGSYAKQAIIDLANKGIIAGVDATHYGPSESLTRAQFATLVVKALGLKADATASSFTDVSGWAVPYVEAAAKAGLIKGEGNGKFNPDGALTREAAATIMVNALKTKGQIDTAGTLNFNDAGAISDWAKPFVAAAAKYNLVKGYNNNFDPQGTATREQAAALVNNFLGAVDSLKANLLTDIISDTTVKIGDTRYDLASNAQLSINGALISDNGSKKGIWAFVKGMNVTYTLDSSGNIRTLTANYSAVTGKADGSGNDVNGAFISVGGKTYSTADKYYTVDKDGKVDYKGSFQTNAGYQLVLNNDGKVVLAISDGQGTLTGSLTAVGTNSNGDNYAVIGGQTYVFDSGVTVQIDGTNATNGLTDVAAQIKDYPMLASVTLNGANKITGKFNALHAWFSGPAQTTGGVAGDGTVKLAVGAYVYNPTIASALSADLSGSIKSTASITIDGKTTQANGTDNTLTTLANYIKDNSNISIKVTLDKDKKVTSIEAAANVVHGEVSAYRWDSTDLYVTVNGKEYKVNSSYQAKFTATSWDSTGTGGAPDMSALEAYDRKGYPVIAVGMLDTKGKLVATDVYAANKNYKGVVVSATPYEAGRTAHVAADTYKDASVYPSLDQNGNAYTGPYMLAIQKTDGSVQEVVFDNTNGYVLDKDGNEIKFATIKKGAILDIVLEADKTITLADSSTKTVKQAKYIVVK